MNKYLVLKVYKIFSPMIIETLASLEDAKAYVECVSRAHPDDTYKIAVVQDL